MSIKSVLANASLASAAVLLAIGTGPARADVLTASLDVLSMSGMSGFPGSITSVGTIVATDHVGYVDVLVTLNTGADFINTGGSTGGPHSPFVYNVNPATLATVVTPPTVTGTPGFQPDTSHPVEETPYGNFSNGILYDGQNGGGHGNHGPLEFRLAGLTVYNFVANSDGYYFGADVIPCATCGAYTGGVAANHITITVDHPGGNPAVPEPSTWAMMLLGFLGVGFMAYRRRGTALQFRAV